MRPDSLSDLLSAVYDSVLEPQSWSRTLPLISEFGQSAASSIVVQDRNGGSGGRVFEHGADQSFLRLYFEKLAFSNLPPSQPAALERQALDTVGEIATMTMLAGEREIQNSDFYLSWVKPLGFRDVIGVVVLRSGRRVGWFSVARSGVQARYSEKDVRLMGLLSPHVCRALLLSDALDLQTIASTRLEETVDSLSTGIFLTEDHGRITYMNSAAERLLKAGTALSARNGRLGAVGRAARESLSIALVQSAAGRAPLSTGRHAVALPDQAGGGLIASVLPLEWRNGRNPLAALPGAAAVIVQDPASPAMAPLVAFAELHGLTAAEVRVLEHVGQGKTPQQAAAELGVSVTTVKTHLQRLFAKTGVRRQAELLHLLERSTPPLRAR